MQSLQVQITASSYQMSKAYSARAYWLDREGSLFSETRAKVVSSSSDVPGSFCAKPTGEVLGRPP